MRSPYFYGAGGAIVGSSPQVVVLTVALALGGCATSRQSQDYQYQAGAPRAYVRPHKVAAVPPKIAMEDDGHPSQLPPRIRPQAEPDDPSEPFSPNYGPPLPGTETSPPQQTTKPVHKVRLSKAEIDRVIAQAIAMHETRTP